MTEYIVKSSGEHHTLKAVTFIQGNDLRFIGEGGSIAAIFTSFEWLKVVPTAETPQPADTSSTDSPVLAG